MTTGNAINANTPGIVRYDGTGTFTGLTTTNHAIQVGAASNGLTSLATGSSGQILQSGGAGADPSFSTATFPSTSGSSGTLLQSNGTNWANTTATYPGTSGTTGTILRSDGTNWVNTTATYPATTTVNQILYSSSANVIGGITTANNSVVLTNASGVPSLGTSLINDFTFTSSTAGGSRTVTTTNTDNTSGTSNAFFIASVGGTSAGDAYNRYAIGTARSFSTGIDNSDSQSFKINTVNSASSTPSAGTNLARLDTSGNLALPLNACCTADLNTGLTNATGDGTTISPLIFDVDSGGFFDQNGNYNTTTGVFTANATGKYFVNCTVTLNNLAAGHTTGILQILLNGSAYFVNVFNPGVGRTGSNEYAVAISGILPVAATGTITVSVQVSGSTKTVGVKGNTFGSYTRLSAVLVS